MVLRRRLKIGDGAGRRFVDPALIHRPSFIPGKYLDKYAALDGKNSDQHGQHAALRAADHILSAVLVGKMPIAPVTRVSAQAATMVNLRLAPIAFQFFVIPECGAPQSLNCLLHKLLRLRCALLRIPHVRVLRLHARCEQHQGKGHPTQALANFIRTIPSLHSHSIFRRS